MSDLKIVRTHHQRGLWKGWKVALFLGKEEASRLWVVVKPIRIGSATVTIGGIAGVGTPEKHRKKGYASRVMDASTELMVEQVRQQLGMEAPALLSADSDEHGSDHPSAD